jgi:hypothetical protein
MLNKNKERELAYVVKVDAIEPIEGKDRVEAAVIGGWRTMVRKGLFQPGDLGIYIEIDSKTPETEPFEFLSKYHYKVKTQKFKQFYSQGLLMHPSDFGWTVESAQFAGGFTFVKDDKGNVHIPGEENMFLTKQLGITYAVADDNKRKAPSEDKYKKMAQRRPDLFKRNWARWMMKREWGKKVMFFFFGKKKDKRGGWPAWVVKTDEERCQNMPWLFTDPQWHDTEWIATEKIDGTSTTFTLKRGKFGKYEFYVCSRNVCFDTPEKAEKCFYDSNVYLEMAYKYHIEEKMKVMLNQDPTLDFITIQGETYGDGIQKRTYSVPSGAHALMAFNLIYGYKDGHTRRMNPCEMTNILTPMGIPCVPVIAEIYRLPIDCDTLLLQATGDSAVDGLLREGIVFRDRKGERSFKAVSNEFLAKYHG